MAAITGTDLTGRIPVGRYFMTTFRFTPSGAAAATDWIVTGFSQVVAVVGTASIGASDSGVNVTKNAQGTGVAEGTNAGDLGVETVGTGIHEVTVIGR